MSRLQNLFKSLNEGNFPPGINSEFKLNLIIRKIEIRTGKLYSSKENQREVITIDVNNI